MLAATLANSLIAQLPDNPSPEPEEDGQTDDIRDGRKDDARGHDRVRTALAHDQSEVTTALPLLNPRELTPRPVIKHSDKLCV